MAWRRKETTGPSAAEGDEISFKIAARANNVQPSGEYNNVINFAVVGTPDPALEPVDCDPGKICYNVNSLGPTEGSMGQQSAGNNQSVTLLASNFSRDGYGFAGWSTTYDYSDPNGFYGPQETITTPADTSTKGLPLYAYWVKSAGSLQGWTGCTSLNKGDVTALTDERDSQTYAVAKLADGNCWMIENLRLEADATRGEANESLSQGYGKSTTYGNFSGLANPESDNFTYSTTANSIYYSGTQSSDATINIGTSDNPGYRMPRYNNLNTKTRASNPTSNTFTNNNTTGGMYSYGNYYTWHAAIADTTNYISVDHGTTSLCPTGWRLPIGNRSTASKSFGALSVALGGPEGGTAANTSSNPTGAVMSGVFRSYPNNFLYSGYFYTSSAYYRGSVGTYWSSTAGGSGGSDDLYLGSTDVRPGTYSDARYLGYSIRCLAGS